MSNSLLEKIKSDAANEVAAITGAAAEKLVTYEAETKALLAAAENVAAEKLEKEKAHMETVALSKARQAGSIAVQRAKREGVDEVFKAVFADIKDADEKTYIEYFTTLGRKVVPEKVSGIATAPVGRVSETETILKALQVDAEVKESKAVAAGFILDTEDGAYDVTLERVFADARPRLEVEILGQVT